MATERQKLAAKLVMENIGKGKGRPLGEILEKVGYKKATSLNPKYVTGSKGFKEETFDFMKALEAERNRILKAMANRDIEKTGKGSVAFHELSLALDRITKNLELLSGRPTERVKTEFSGWTPQEIEDYANKGIKPKRYTDEGES